jgi:hypothetical protein
LLVELAVPVVTEVVGVLKVEQVLCCLTLSRSWVVLVVEVVERILTVKPVELEGGVSC